MKRMHLLILWKNNSLNKAFPDYQEASASFSKRPGIGGVWTDA